jgi:3-deoxy-D-manno-octulosonic-acid transferase
MNGIKNRSAPSWKPFIPVASRLALGIYQAVMNLLAPPAVVPFLPLVLLIRKRRKTFFPRLGFQNYPSGGKSPFQPLWIHALSVGELHSCLPLIKELRGKMPSLPLVLSVSTLAAHEVATEKTLAYVDGIFYFPYDLLCPVRRCLGKIRPALFLLIETDIWPGFLAELRRLDVPCFLLNARLSPSSFRMSRLLSALFLPAFNTFSRIYPQSPEEGERLLNLGVEASHLHRSGNLKFDLAGSLPSSQAITAMRRDLGLDEQDRVILAGSTHSGEEAVLRSVFLTLRQRFSPLKLFIVPRHPDRSPEVLQLFDSDPVRVSRFSQRQKSSADVVVVDRMGMLGSLYTIADVAFVGGSLAGKGGQNPIEPAAAGRPVLFGPDMSDFPDVSRQLLDAGGAIQVRDAGELLDQCTQLIEDRSLAQAVGMRARAVVDKHRGASRTIAEEIAAFLSQSTSQPPPRALNKATRFDETL